MEAGKGDRYLNMIKIHVGELLEWQPLFQLTEQLQKERTIKCGSHMRNSQTEEQLLFW